MERDFQSVLNRNRAPANYMENFEGILDSSELIENLFSKEEFAELLKMALKG